MDSHTVPISTKEMIDYLQGHESRWERYKQISDDPLLVTDYGYDITVLGKDRAAEIIDYVCRDIYANEDD